MSYWMSLYEGDDVDNGGDGGDAAAAAAAEAERKAKEEAEKAKGPTDAEAKLLKEVMEKKEALKKVNAEKAELAEKLARFDGVDLEAVKQLLAEKQERENAELERKGEWDRLKAQMAEQHKKELERLTGEATGKVSELSEKLSKREREIQELTIGRSFSESSFIRDSLTLTPSKARVVYGAHFDLVDGKIVGYDKPAGSAERTALVDGNGDPLTFEKAIEKLVELDPDRDQMLKSKIRAGAGSDNDSDAKKREKDKHLTGRDRILAGLKSGALKLPTAK